MFYYTVLITTHTMLQRFAWILCLNRLFLRMPNVVCVLANHGSIRSIVFPFSYSWFSLRISTLIKLDDMVNVKWIAKIMIYACICFKLNKYQSVYSFLLIFLDFSLCELHMWVYLFCLFVFAVFIDHVVESIEGVTGAGTEIENSSISHLFNWFKDKYKSAICVCFSSDLIWCFGQNKKNVIKNV